jgi:hypothetical protein
MRRIMSYAVRVTWIIDIWLAGLAVFLFFTLFFAPWE